MNKYLEKVKKEINLIKSLLRSRSASNGMTYVEIIVVLSIFSMLSGVAIYNYGDFQAKVDIKNLASDIALKVVEAQKSSLAGNLPLQTPTIDPNIWKPSYGVYFNKSSDIDTDGIAFNKKFTYFVDLNNVNGYDPGEKLDTIRITKNNFISDIDKCDANPCVSLQPPINSFSIAFKRPDSGATLTGVSLTGPEYIQITIKSPKDTKSYIKLYPSGRVQVN